MRHANRNDRVVKVNVTRLHAFNPWSDETPDTAPLTKSPTPTTHSEWEADTTPPLVGDLIIIAAAQTVPSDPPFRIAEVLNLSPAIDTQDNLTVQWYGNDKNILLGKYTPGWLHQEDKWYYRGKRLHKSHRQLTNINDNVSLSTWNVCFQGFQLTTTNEIPLPLLKAIHYSEWITWTSPDFD
jgi:hypothetical protein